MISSLHLATSKSSLNNSWAKMTICLILTEKIVYVLSNMKYLNDACSIYRVESPGLCIML
jgi:hypothetical protein